MCFQHDELAVVLVEVVADVVLQTGQGMRSRQRTRVRTHLTLDTRQRLPPPDGFRASPGFRR